MWRNLNAALHFPNEIVSAMINVSHFLFLSWSRANMISHRPKRIVVQRYNSFYSVYFQEWFKKNWIHEYGTRYRTEELNEWIFLLENLYFENTHLFFIIFFCQTIERVKFTWWKKKNYWALYGHKSW